MSVTLLNDYWLIAITALFVVVDLYQQQWTLH